MVEFLCAHDFTPESQDSIAYYVSSISTSRPTFCSILRTETQIGLLSNSRHHDMCVVNHLVIKGSELQCGFNKVTVTEIIGGAYCVVPFRTGLIPVRNR